MRVLTLPTLRLRVTVVAPGAYTGLSTACRYHSGTATSPDVVNSSVTSISSACSRSGTIEMFDAGYGTREETTVPREWSFPCILGE